MSDVFPMELYLAPEISPQVLAAPLPGSFSNEVVEKLKREADRYWGIDPHRSLLFADRIVAIGQARADPGQIALGMMARGDALKFLGRTREAWEALEQAGRIYQAAGDEVGWARTCIGRLYLSPMLQCVPEALAEAEQARAIFVRRGEREKLFRLEIQIAYVFNEVGDPLAAIDHFHSALALAEELGEPALHFLGALLTNLGSAYQSLGDLDQARAYYERARRLFIDQGETLHLATVETNLALIDQAHGHYRQALQWLNDALEQAAGHSDLETAKIKWHLLECYLGLNRLAEARDLARQIVADTRRFGHSLELARALVHLGTAEAELGNLLAAQAALGEAEELFVALGSPTWQATTWLRSGRIALRRGDYAAAAQKAMEASAVFAAAGHQLHQAQAQLLRGQASLELARAAVDPAVDGAAAAGEISAATGAGTIALLAGRQHNLPALRYSAHLLLGQVAEAQNRHARAVRHFQAAAATIERVQSGLTITLQPGFLEDKWDAWRALIALHLSHGQIGKAFETLERAKSQVLVGHLVNRERLRWDQDDPRSRALIAELARLRAEQHGFYHLAQEAPTQPVVARNPDQALFEARTRERRMRAITEQLYLHSAGNQPAHPARTPTAVELQEALEENTLLIEYYNDGRQWWAFTLESGSIEIHRLSVSSSSVSELLDQLQVNLAAALQLAPQSPAAGHLTRLARRILQRFYDFLLQPLGERRRNKQRLVVVPYGALHFLPFHLLYDGAAYLIERQEVVILPAAGLALHPTPVRPPGALVLAHSWGGRLPLTQAEGQAVHELFGGVFFTEEQATRASLQRPPGRILHIAAHGQYRLDQPDLSFLELADGPLFADDLLQQDLSYELVTLSACETGRARVAGGEELIGLGRGFLYAGAGALVLSLWPVPDETTVHLMGSMYRALQGGASKAAALQDAQRSLISATHELHPAFWGAFQLVGNPGPFTSPATPAPEAKFSSRGAPAR